MFLLSSICLLLVLIAIVLLCVIEGLSQKSFSEEEKASPFECGFLPQKPARSPFSVHFFLLAILFLVFDIELVLLFPWLLLKLALPAGQSAFFFTLLLLLLGLLYEWNAKILEWID